MRANVPVNMVDVIFFDGGLLQGDDGGGDSSVDAGHARLG